MADERQNTYRQCVLRKKGTNRYVAALWVLDKHVRSGEPLLLQLTNPRTGAMGSWRGRRFVEGAWDSGWEIHKAGGKRSFLGTNNKTKIETTP